MSLTITFDSATTGLDAIQRAAYALSEVMTLDVTPVPSGWSCVVHPRTPDLDPAELGHALRARVLDEVLRARIAEETAGVRNLVLAIAYSQIGTSPEVVEGGLTTPGA